MGKGLLFIVGAFFISASSLLFGSRKSAFDTRQEQSEYEYQVIARDIAESGYDQALSEVRRALMNVEHSRTDVAMAGGSYDMSFSDNLYGDLDFNIEAESGGAGHRIQGNVIFEAPVPAALALSGAQVIINDVGTAYRISGFDVRAPSRGSGPGFFRPAPGIITQTSHRSLVSNALLAENVVGAGAQGVGSVAGGFSGALYETIYSEARNRAHTTIGTLVESGLRESMLRSAMSGSSPDNPQIVRVRGPMVVTGPLTGYGLLIVEDGTLSITSSDFHWEGLILVRKNLEDTVNVSFTNGTLYGGLVVYDGKASDPMSADFSSTIGVRTVVVKAGSATYTDAYDPGVTFGTFSSPGSAISHVSFCDNGESGDVHSGVGENDCPDGTSLIAKFNWVINSFVFEKGFDESAITISNVDVGEEGEGPSGLVQFTIGGEAELHYSAEAIAKLGKHLDVIRQASRVVVTRQEGTAGTETQ